MFGNPILRLRQRRLQIKEVATPILAFGKVLVVVLRKAEQI